MPRVLLGCHAFVWRVGGSLLSLLRFHCGTKGIALCGVLLPSTPLWNVFALLCAAALRYSSLMFQVPLWTSIKALEYPIWSLGALSPSVRCCLPAPCLPCLCVVSLCPCVVLPPLLCPLSSGIDVPVLPGHVRAFSFLFVSGRLSCVLSRSVGAPVRCLRVEFVVSLFGATQSLWSLAVSSPRFAFAFAVLALVVSWFLVVCWWAPFSGSYCWGLIGEVGPASEPWTGLHCSEFHWR